MIFLLYTKYKAVQPNNVYVYEHLKILWHGEDNSAGDNERSKKERKIEGEIER